MAQEAKEVKNLLKELLQYLKTLRKQGRNVLKFIESSIKSFYSDKEPELINPVLDF